MLARRLEPILPVMTVGEALETTRIHRVAGLTGARTTLSCEASSLATDQPSSLVHAEAQLGIFTKSNVGN